MSKGHWGFTSGLKYCSSIQSGGDGIPNRIMVSVPKRLFKRAVRRNLLKRRLREAYRRSKDLLGVTCGCDIMFIYNSKEVADYKEIKEAVEKIMAYVKDKIDS